MQHHPKRPPGALWGRSGTTLDIPWTHRTPVKGRFRSAQLIQLRFPRPQRARLVPVRFLRPLAARWMQLGGCHRPSDLAADPSENWNPWAARSAPRRLARADLNRAKAGLAL